ncbi:MAG: GNAT family N-acetyltransferase [Acidobacteriota bacterium]|nr:GNAT family N-acetyltransferase [Acidobacteriota bacterium]
MNHEEITFRAATNRDAEKIKEIVFGVLHEYGLKHDSSGTDADLNDIEASYIKRGGLFEVLETPAGEIVGTVGLYPITQETVELRKMYFAKEIRGLGLGKKTLQRMIERAAELDFKRIYLETNSRLKEAIGLYQKFGFKETDEKHAARCDQAFILNLD